ncbi:HEAT repeat domain-containing protein [Myxococcus sp. MISCRS1]|uniref:HEAT repeat domain-containing protein n=1 Tax=Myxococcus sp. MISCRS1 TaxID=2996786 RepID=UPI00227123DF|nr:HEAT repeat domain-containing protein [Myxococcus sp. MISCRS1]MCY1001814.1 HEAT repeat domain-containing protein [Myxococcus sp. MISCRS1]
MLAALSDPDTVVVGRAVATLGDFDLHPSVQAKLDEIARGPVLLEWLSSDDERLVESALTLFRIASDATTPHTPQLVEWLKDTRARPRAERALVILGGRASAQAPRVAELLRDADPLVRAAAARTLTRLAGYGGARFYALELLKDSSPELRVVAAVVIEQMEGGLVAPDPLVRELLSDSAAPVKIAGVKALSSLRWEASQHALHVAALLNDPDNTVKVAAIEALGTMGLGAATQAPHVAGLLKDSRVSIQMAAIKALGSMGKGAAAQAPQVAELLIDDDVSIREAAIGALGNMGPGAAAQAPRIAEMLKASEEAPVRVAATLALGKMGRGAEKQVPLLVKLLTDADSDVREVAVTALASMAEAGVFEASQVAKLLKSEDPLARRMALRVLWPLGSKAESQSTFIVELLGDPDASVRQAASTALQAIGAGAAVHAPRVARLLRASNPDIKMVAADALRHMGEVATAQVPLVAELLRDPNDNVRLAGLDALKVMGQGAAAHAQDVAGLLRASNSMVRKAAVETLGAMGQSAAPHARDIATLFNDPDALIRRSAVEALGSMGEEAVAQSHLFADLLKDSQAIVRRSAVVALGAMGKAAMAQAPRVAVLLRDSDEEVYERAHSVLTGLAPLEPRATAKIVEAVLAGGPRYPELLVLAHIAGEGDPVMERVLQWVVRPATQKPKDLSAAEARAMLLAFRDFWPLAEQDSPLEEALADSIEKVARPHLGAWDASEDREFIEELHGLLLKKHPLRAETLRAIPAQQQRWEWPQLKWVPLLHATVWILLIFLYPRSRQVQAVFFWNRRVRQVLGFPYVGLLLTWVPFLRKRLLSPFKRGLTADAALDAFVPDAYFPELEAREPALKTRGRLANLLPHLSGHVVLEGASGLGKSTYLKHLLSKSTRTSVFLRADRCQAGVLEAIQAKLEGYAKDSVFLKSLIFSGALDVYIDGLNEVSADVRARVVQFMEENLQGNILVTTQRIEWTPPSTARLLVLEPLSDSAITGFLKSREPFLDGAAALGGDSYATRCECFVKDALSTAQDGHAGRSLREVLSNPLDLTVVAQMLRNGQPPDLSQLRQQQYELMAREYAEAHLSEFPLGRFAEEAYQMRKASRSTLDEATFSLELLTLERAKLVLRRQWKRPDGKDQQEWRFRHDKIQEFFVAQTFLDPSKSRELEHMGDPPFRGVYFFLMAYLSLERAQMLCGLLVEHAAETGDHSVSDECVKLLKARARDACMPNPGKVVEFGKRSGAPKEG